MGLTMELRWDVDLTKYPDWPDTLEMFVMVVETLMMYYLVI